MAMSAKEVAERSLSTVKNLIEFTDEQVHGVVQSVLSLSPSDKQNCILALYYRAYADMQTLARCEGAKDFQSVSRIARAMLEYAVDLRLSEITPDATNKQIAFLGIERLRIAKQIVAFKRDFPTARTVVTTYQAFIDEKERAIMARQNELWPDLKKVEHWSGINRIAARCRTLGLPFVEWYEVDFRRLSLHSHSGLLGIVDLPADAFNASGALALRLIVETYCEVIRCVIRELNLQVVSEKIDRLLEFATMVSFTEGGAEAQQLFSELMKK
jgi:hypothetical protein